MSRFVVERLNPDFGYFYSVKKSLHKGQTKWQAMEIVETDEFGRVLLLDGVTQVAQKHEYLYHEPMVHLALTSHPAPKDVLIIGAGDGGILREVLKHPVDTAVMAELDGGVVDFCDRLMPEINQGAFKDPRYQLEVGDGRKYVETTDRTFDAVVMDMTDPFGPSAMLYTREFFQHVKATFKDGNGLFVMHTESPIARPNTFKQCLRTLGDVFKHRRTFYLYIQMYAVLWSITVCSDEIDVGAIPPAELAKRLEARGIKGLQVYTPAVHHSMLVPFPFVADIVADAVNAPAITDASPKVIDDIDINSAGDLVLSEGRAPAKPARAAAKRVVAKAKAKAKARPVAAKAKAALKKPVKKAGKALKALARKVARARPGAGGRKR
jgi:spermidine synthase